MNWYREDGNWIAHGESGTLYRIMPLPEGFWLESGDCKKHPADVRAVGRKAKTVRYLKRVSQELENERMRKLNEKLPGYTKPK